MLKNKLKASQNQKKQQTIFSSSAQGLEEGLDLREVSYDPVKDGDDQDGYGNFDGASGFLRKSEN